MTTINNKVQLIGVLGNNPEVRVTETGKKMARFSIAIEERYHNAKGDKVTETQWHNVVTWGKVAEITEKFLTKGSNIVLEGKLINRNYTDKDGVKRYICEVQAHELLMLGDNKN